MDVSAHQSLGGSGRRIWGRRLAAAGFAFFLVKGLLWLAVPAALYLLQ